MQKIHLTGYLAKDPEVRTTPAGLMVVNLSMPISEKWKDKTTGELREETEWFRIVLFGKNAENAQKYLKKGSCIALEGKLKTRKWHDKDTGIEKSATDVMCDSFKMFGERTSKTSNDMNALPPSKIEHGNDFVDDIPF
jgi:single-strand DNA-binding protein